MGSGETSPTMVTPHQNILREVPKQSAKTVFLDTPFGFQENADELTARITEYFNASVGRDIQVVTLRSSSEQPATVAQAIADLSEAEWLFAGPGSPTYALHAWQDTGLAKHVSEVLNRGSVVFASAAALTLGSHTVPVYEIYKVGQKPHWLPGLNILAEHTGLKAAVIPHFDNAEGGNHDTRFCYLGETRLRFLESELPEDTFVLGIDEHTGVTFDLDRQVASVFGRGKMTLRKGAVAHTIPSGSEITFAQIAQTVAVPHLAPEPTKKLESSLTEAREKIVAGDIAEAVQLILDADALDRDSATVPEIHSLIVQLGALAQSPKVDKRELIGPYIQLLLDLRNQARADGRWAGADAIRDFLKAQGIEIKDSADGTNWEFVQ